MRCKKKKTEEVMVLEKILKALNDLKSDTGFIKKHITSKDWMKEAEAPNLKLEKC
jgi:hypothetical protein